MFEYDKIVTNLFYFIFLSLETFYEKNEIDKVSNSG